MKFNCVHIFSLEAADREEFDQKLADYGRLVRRASEKLGIGYGHGLVVGQPGSGRSEKPKEETPLERLFEE